MSRTATVSPQYLSIALDIAGRIARGELKAGNRIPGRSLLSSEYGVSPETVRRALCLLGDMKVISVKPQSGTVVLSQDNAKRYLSRFAEHEDERTMVDELRELLLQCENANRRITELVSSIIKSRCTYATFNGTLPTYEVTVSSESPLIGKNIGDLKFWQVTGGTVAAIRRGKTVILSPGPYAELYGGDVIILVGTPAAAEASDRFVNAKEASYDTL